MKVLSCELRSVDNSMQGRRDEEGEAHRRVEPLTPVWSSQLLSVKRSLRCNPRWASAFHLLCLGPDSGFRRVWELSKSLHEEQVLLSQLGWALSSVGQKRDSQDASQGKSAHPLPNLQSKTPKVTGPVIMTQQHGTSSGDSV